MFNFFPFKGGGVFTFGSVSKIDDMVESFFGNVSVNEITDLYEDVFSGYFENTDEEKNEEKGEFIKLQSYEDMYILTIELKGIDLRELSIQYNPGIIDINLKRLEINSNGLGIKRQEKKYYNKKFDNIEEIDTDNILKSIEKEILTIRMPKKFSIDASPEIVDIDYTEVVDIDYTEVLDSNLLLVDKENNSH